MAQTNCAACDELRNDAPNFVVNGLTNTEIASLKNNTGLNPSNANDDCKDLNNMNDCLIANIESELENYNVCDWKAYMKKLVPNMWSMFKAIIAAICGLWANINSILKQIDNILKQLKKHQCEIDYLFNGASFSFGENTEGKQSKVVPGKGADFSIRQGSETHSFDVTITYVAGGLARLSGSIRTFTESFKDANGETKSGNSVWDFSSNNFDLPAGGELLYEIRIKKSEYPQIKRIFNGNGYASGGNNDFFQAMYLVFDGDSWDESKTTARYAYGQHGWCDEDGTPSRDGYSAGHKVPQGWIYVQVRMYYVGHLPVGNVTDGSGATKRGTNFSPAGYLGMRMNKDEIDC